MKIGIDISYISKDRVGVDQYLYNLLRAISGIDRDNSYFLYSNKDVPEEFKGLGNNFKIVIYENRNLPRLLWMQFVLPGLLKRDRIDLLHAPCYIAPTRAGCPVVITFHDMASWLFPGMFRLKHRVVYSLFVPFMARKAERIIAVSKATKQDMIKLFRIPGKKITVVYEGTNELFRPVDDAGLLENTRRKYSLPEKYMLFVGMLEPRKNIPVLLRAFSKLKESGTEHKLVLVGKKGWLCDDIFKTVEFLKLEDEVIFTGYIADRELPAVYSAAELFVYPSTYEGFGLPPLEAMACGVPVVTSGVSSLPEVAGDAALMVAPDNVEEIAGAMKRVLSDNSLRQSMRMKGFERVKTFSWEKAARETLDVYRGMVYD